MPKRAQRTPQREIFKSGTSGGKSMSSPMEVLVTVVHFLGVVFLFVMHMNKIMKFVTLRRDG